jgi:hypothetical protein
MDLYFSNKENLNYKTLISDKKNIANNLNDALSSLLYKLTTKLFNKIIPYFSVTENGVNDFLHNLIEHKNDSIPTIKIDKDLHESNICRIDKFNDSIVET